jgi:predicted nucleic acid-binding protein
MRLVVDTSVLVGELLRSSGRARLGDGRLELFLPEQMAGELSVELPRRIRAFVRRRGLPPSIGDDLLTACTAAIDANVLVLDEAVYAALEDEARARAERDPDDWPVVASALALGAGVWTNDNDFLGTGVATWTTPTLQAWLDRQPGVRRSPQKRP